MDLMSLFDFASVIHQNRVGRSILFLLRRLQSLCQNTANYQPTEHDDSVMTRMLCPVLMNLSGVRNEIIELLWAVPGMATYLLNLELISDPMRKRRSENRPPTSTELEFQGFDPAFQVHKHFSAAVSYFLLASILKSQDGDGENDDPTYRNTSCAAAAAQRMMKWYADPFNRVSVQCTLKFRIPRGSEDFCRSPRDFHFCMVLEILLKELPDDSADIHALVPGLSVQDTFRIMVEEPTWALYVTDSNFVPLARSLVLSSSTKTTAWKDFSVQARASVAHQLVDRFYYRKDDLTEAVHFWGGYLEAIVVGLDRITDAYDDVLWLQVIKLAARNENSVGPHTQYFQQWYLRTREVVELSLQYFLELSIDERGLASDLIPPAPVLAMVADYALEPYGKQLAAPRNCIADLFNNILHTNSIMEAASVCGSRLEMLTACK